MATLLGKKYEDIIPSTHNTDVPFVKNFEYTLIDINEEGKRLHCLLLSSSSTRL